MEKRRVVITGMGAVTPLGHTVQETWDAVRARRVRHRPITLYDHSSQKVSLAAEVKDFDPTRVLDKKEARRMDRFTQFAVTAAVEAMAQSGLDLEREDTARMGVSVSSGIGGISTIQNSCESGQSRGFDKVSPFFIPMAISNLAARAHRHPFRPAWDVHRPCGRLRRRQQRGGRRLPPHPGRVRRCGRLRRYGGCGRPPGHRRLHQPAGGDHLQRSGAGLHPL